MLGNRCLCFPKIDRLKGRGSWNFCAALCMGERSNWTVSQDCRMVNRLLSLSNRKTPHLEEPAAYRQGRRSVGLLVRGRKMRRNWMSFWNGTVSNAEQVAWRSRHEFPPRHRHFAFLKGDHRVGNRVIQYGGRLHVSAITVAELFTWALRSKAPPSRLQGLLELLDGITLLDVDRTVSQKFGEIRADQLDRGWSAPQMDLLIAATAMSHDLTLVTHNIGDFASVPNLEIMDWLAS
jgi:tRNA(fMet)-specific endonuclease VapC